MPKAWYPAALRDPGVAAGYARGRTKMRTVKCHYTVGVSSGALIRNQGLAQWLVSRDGTVTQYAEADALCWDSGEFNDDGPGIEVEYYQPQDGDEIFTPEALTATAALVDWLHEEWGVPLEYYDGPRVPEGVFSGFIAHKSLQQTQPHYDYWPREDWDRMVTTAPPTPTPGPDPEDEDDMIRFITSAENPGWGIHAQHGPWHWKIDRPAQIDELVAKGLAKAGNISLTAEAWTALRDLDAELAKP